MEKSNKKPLIAIALVALIAVVGGTIAFFTTTKTFENLFTTGKYQTTTQETFESPSNWMPGQEVSKTVTVTNSGDYDVAVRVSYTQEWTAADGNTHPALKVGDKDVAIINFDNATDWKLSGGYYYYQSKLTKNNTTSSFIKSVTLNDTLTMEELGITCSQSTSGNTKTYSCVSSNDKYAGATYKLTITVETMQWDHAAEQWSIGDSVISGVEQD